MKKIIKSFLIIVMTMVLFTNIIATTSYSSEYSDINLIQDSNKIEEIPRHFRKSTDSIQINENKKLNLYGLDKLNISGSAQFSDKGLSLIKESIGDKFNITVVDLREESHGFINGIPISFENKNNNANKGLSLDEIVRDENKRLQSIELNKPIIFYNNGKTIIPEEVYNEETLVKNNNLSYIRIPVTDGELPSNDMVNYFISVVKNEPQNGWLHFHCKAGEGRTTTFMIMYDIMKNCNDVNLMDIVTRQVKLSGMSEDSAQGFYTGDRFKFFSDFYNKCKNGSLEAFRKHESNYENDFYIKNCIIPKKLYVISDKDMIKEEKTMIATLQGLIATKSDEQIYILTKNEPDYNTWLTDLKDNYNVKYETIKNPWELLSKFNKYIKGYILYNHSNPYSINNACSLASIKESIVINESLEEKIKEYGITNLIKDCRDTDKYWAYNNLWNKGLNHSTVIELNPNKTMALRDYAIVSKSLVFYEEDVNNSELREKIFKSMDDVARVLGWGPDEHTNVSIASKYGVDVIAADWSYNLSVLSSYPIKQQNQKNFTKAPVKDNVHYVTFVMSDGDNQQWFLGNNFNAENWYGSQYRGKFNLGWSISPSIYYLAPTVFNKYYESASNGKYRDYYLAPPSGNGYMYPSKFPNNKLSNYTERLSNYMKNVDQNYVLILDDDSLYRKDLWNKYTSHNNINGLFYLDYKKNNSYNGEIVWSNNKPVVSCSDLIWGGIEEEEYLIDSINNKIKLGYTDIKNPKSYSFVYVHVWSKNMSKLNNVINTLNKNENVQIITPDTFMNLIKENVKPTN